MDCEWFHSVRQGLSPGTFMLHPRLVGYGLNVTDTNGNVMTHSIQQAHVNVDANNIRRINIDHNLRTVDMFQ